MSRLSLRIIAAISVLSSLVLISTPASAGGCAQVTAMNAGSPWTFAGGLVGVGTAVTNCSGKKSRYVVVHSFTSACGQTTTYNSSQVAFGPGASMIVTTTLNVPPTACAGGGVITAKVYDRNSVISSGSTTLLVQ